MRGGVVVPRAPSAGSRPEVLLSILQGRDSPHSGAIQATASTVLSSLFDGATELLQAQGTPARKTPAKEGPGRILRSQRAHTSVCKQARSRGAQPGGDLSQPCTLSGPLPLACKMGLTVISASQLLLGSNEARNAKCLKPRKNTL